MATVTPPQPVPIPPFATPRAVARWLRSWLAGEAVGTWGALYGLGEADCVAAVAAVGWPVPGNERAAAMVEGLERGEAMGRGMVIVGRARRTRYALKRG